MAEILLAALWETADRDCHVRSSRQFRSTFGVPPAVVFLVWNTYLPFVSAFEILSLFHFLKTYPTGDQASAFWNKDPRGWSNNVFKNLERLYHIMDEVFARYTAFF